MPGIFGLFDFTKPGKGVDKDAPEKARFIVLFEIFFRKFWNLLKLNLMFIIFNLPAYFIAFFITYIIMPEGLVPLNNPLVTSDYAALGEVFIRAIIGLLFCIVPLVTVGPFQCGFTYVLRNYAREEHAFLWGDFIEHTKKNWKQSLVVTLIDIVVLSIILFALSFYFTQESSTASFIFGIVSVGLGLFMMMHIFLYQMLVTFHVTIKQLYVNCFKFAMFKFIPNALILLLCALITVLPFIIPSFGYMIGSFLFVIITMSLNGLILNFYAYPLLKKYMLDKPANGAQEENKEEPEQIESIDETSNN